MDAVTSAPKGTLSPEKPKLENGEPAKPARRPRRAPVQAAEPEEPSAS